MKILVDMNLSPGWVSFLAGAGIEAVHWSEVGSGNAPDSELMQWAAERGYIVLTADLDFGAILAASQSIGPSVVQVRNDILTPRAIGGAVVAAIQQSRQELLDGALVSVDAARGRGCSVDAARGRGCGSFRLGVEGAESEESAVHGLVHPTTVVPPRGRRSRVRDRR